MKIKPQFYTALLAVIVSAIGPTANGQTSESLKTIENQFFDSFQLQVEEGHFARVAELDGRYLLALERALQGATQANRLQEALGLRGELDRVKGREALPDTDEGVDAALGRLRSAYREQLAKLNADRAKAAAPIVKKFDEALVAHQTALTKSGRLDEAKVVLTYREEGGAAKLLGIGRELLSPKPDQSIITALSASAATLRVSRDKR